jgi:hypothetical protein
LVEGVAVSITSATVFLYFIVISGWRLSHS